MRGEDQPSLTRGAQSCLSPQGAWLPVNECVRARRSAAARLKFDQAKVRKTCQDLKARGGKKEEKENKNPSFFDADSTVRLSLADIDVCM